jgi:hypothetical protein
LIPAVDLPTLWTLAAAPVLPIGAAATIVSDDHFCARGCSQVVAEVARAPTVP